MMTDQVAGYINYFSNRGRGTFERAFARSGRYHDMIVSILKEEGVPQDLIYLAQAESGFHPLAVSRAGARGIWQFMASRAHGYGLDAQHVGRRSPGSRKIHPRRRASPERSLQPVRRLVSRHGRLQLRPRHGAERGQAHRLRRFLGTLPPQRSAQRNAQLRSHHPGRHHHGQEPAQYGLDDVSMDDPANYDTVTINYPVDLRLVAECVDATAADIAGPESQPAAPDHAATKANSSCTCPPGREISTRPRSPRFRRDMRVWWRYHKVQSGDTLASLARTYHITAKSIAESQPSRRAPNSKPTPSW